MMQGGLITLEKVHERSPAQHAHDFGADRIPHPRC
jgi:hypothetical protein